MPINYDLAKRESPRLKAELTRAQKKGSQAVLDAAQEVIMSESEFGVVLEDLGYYGRIIGTEDGEVVFVAPAHTQLTSLKLNEVINKMAVWEK